MSAADRLASGLVEIAARTPGTKKDETLRTASYVELVLYLAERKTTHGQSFNPTASEIYDQLDVGSEGGRGRVERVGVTNIRSNELLRIDAGKANFAGFDADGKKQWSTPSKTEYGIGELPKQTVAAAEDLEITLNQGARTALAKAAEEAAESGRPEEATEELAQALGNVGTEGEPRGDTGPGPGQDTPTNGLDNDQPSTPQNRRSERSDRDEVVDACAVNPPVEVRVVVADPAHSVGPGAVGFPRPPRAETGCDIRQRRRRR